MKFKTLLLASALPLFLQACSSGPTFADKLLALNVHADNHVAYTVRTNASADITRVWSWDNNVLVLSLPTRLINAHDIASVETYRIQDPRLSLRVVTTLRSGEVVQGDFAAWGEGIDWMACTPSKVCETVERANAHIGLPKMKTLLVALSESRLSDEAKKMAISKAYSGNTDGLLRHDYDSALPDSQRVSMKFSSGYSKPDIKAELPAFVQMHEKRLQCGAAEDGRIEREHAEQQATSLKKDPSDRNRKAWALENATRSNWTNRLYIDRKCESESPSPWKAA